MIASFKLFKGTLLTAVGVGALSLVHRDVAELLTGIVDALRVDPGNRYLRGLLVGLGLVSDRQLKEIGVLTLLYAALFFTQGIGLWLEKRWAEYLTIVVTASYVPLELFELWKRITIPRLLIIVVNASVIVYLVRVVRRDGRVAKG